ncbi:hypothetical protein GCM10017608_25760 [Agromyces luteolus]|uniref:histidine kinase n=1 Tax=Agromyces luteolus TaxID=88373 RepID=A0A7C9M189_9MICO|nr:histidine kinase [Agromyces luteolus]MUN08953.1 hypothetical protein [Agromyces luteolus]GLK28641.1 hypothetical protein GCM10017608_25760 [Agromyces luteolus]
MRAIGWGVWVVASACTILALDLIAAPEVIAVGTSDPVATMLAALALLAGAAAALTTAAGLAPGVLLAFAAVCWTAPLVEGHQALPEPVRSVAAICGALLVPVLAAATLAIAGADGRVDADRRTGADGRVDADRRTGAHGCVGARDPDARFRAVARRLAWSILAGAAALVVATALVGDPLLDPDCWANCSANSFLVVSVPPLARALELALPVYAIGAGAVCAWAVAAGIRRSALQRGAGVGIDARTAATAAGALAALAAVVLVLSVQPVQGADAPPAASAPALRLPYLVCAALLVLFGATVAAVAIVMRRRTAAVRRFGDEIRRTPRPGRLEDDLRAALRDPGLRVRFPAGPPGPPGPLGPAGRPASFVDGAGHASAAPEPGSPITEIRRDGAPIAVLEHTVPVASTAELEARIGPAARIAIDNERMRALVLAELDELRASRQRIVETADAARRNIERDLHDRAQQSLLAALFELGLVQARAAEQGDAALERRAAALRERVNVVVESLRTLAHGVFPAVLDDVGLESALEHLAETSRIPLEVHSRLTTRLPAAVERAAYAVAVRVAECTDATAEAVDLEIGEVDGNARLAIRPSPPPRCDLVGVADRVGALGGSMLVSDRGIEVVIPCA